MLLFLALFLPPIACAATPPLPSAPAMAPAFNMPAVPLAQGAVVQPLCHPAYPGSCFQQWTNGAVPLAVSSAGALPQFEYFLPSLAHVQALRPSTSMEGWTRRRSSSGRRSSSSSSDGYYTSRSHPGVVRVVSAQQDGTKSIKEGSAVYVSENDINLPQETRDSLRSGLAAQNPPPSSSPDKPSSPPDAAEAPAGDRGAQPSDEASAGGSAAERSGAERSAAKAGAEGSGDDSKGKGHASLAEGAAPSSPSLTAEVKRDTAAPVLSFDKKIKKACVEGSPQAGAVIDDPVAACHECQANPHLQRAQQSLTDSALSALKALLNAVRLGKGAFKGNAKQKFEEQARRYEKVKADNTKWALSGSMDRLGNKVLICHPDKALDQVARNFNSSCKPETFKEFFPKIYCRSCKAAIPPEIMLGMMTAESAGKCDAANISHLESSLGLFQVNAEAHSCKKNQKDSVENRICLHNIDNNLEGGIQILSKYYDGLSAQERKAPSQCPSKQSFSFSNMPAEVRDGWRRAVSAYNGGAGWINRAVQSIEGKAHASEEGDRAYRAEGRLSGQSTEDLIGAHKGAEGARIKDRAKKSNAAWEELRMYYFMEKLLPGNTQQSGRQLALTVSNLAHVEAILGREKGSDPGIVSYWERYIQKNRPQTCPGS